MTTTQNVLDRHLTCFATADLDGIMLDYAPDAALIVPQGIQQGVDAIREVFRGLFAEFTKPGADFEMEQVLVHGECAYIVWNAKSADNVYEAATDTFVVRDGKIVYQTFAAKITPRARDES